MLFSLQFLTLFLPQGEERQHMKTDRWSFFKLAGVAGARMVVAGKESASDEVVSCVGSSKDAKETAS